MRFATLKIAALLCGLAFASASPAQRVQKSGKISSIMVDKANNLAFRVYLNVSAPECGGGGFIYTDTDNPNYQSHVAGLLTAAASGKSVEVWSVLTNGYCRIDYYTILF